MIKNKIVLVPFPFDDLSSTKVRPAVCLTDSIGPYKHTIVAFISSRIPSDLLDTDLIVRTADPDFTETGLQVDSAIRLHRVMTISISLIRRELGELSIARQIEVENKLKKLFSMIS